MSRRQSEPADVILISEPLRLFKRARHAEPLGFELTAQCSVAAGSEAAEALGG
jgi:hypothetical protein